MAQESNTNSQYLSIFQREVFDQCTFALMGFEDFSNSYQNHNNERFWYGIQSFLVSTANVSKLLWNDSRIWQKENESDEDFAMRQKQHYEMLDRRKALRASLSVSDNSSLRSKLMRHNFEHLDERIDEWIYSSKNHNLANRNIIYEGAIGGLDENDFLCTFNTTKNAITFKDEIYEIKPIVNELRNLQIFAKKEIEKLPWEK